MKTPSPQCLRLQRRVSACRLLTVWICSCALTAAWGAGMQPTGAIPAAATVSNDQFKGATNAIYQELSGLSAKLSGLAGRLDDLTNQVAVLADRANRAQPAAGPVEAGPASARVAELETSIKNVEAQSQAVKDEAAALKASVDKANGTISDLQKAGQDTGALKGQLGMVSNALSLLSGKVDQLSVEVGKLKTLPGGRAENAAAPAPAPAPAAIPGAFWGLLGVNLAVGVCALGAAVVLLRERKSVATQVQAVVAAQIPSMAKSLVEQVNPKLDAAIRQGKELAGDLQKAVENNQKFLDSMKAKHEQQLKSFVDSAESASRTAIEIWATQSRTMLGQLQEKAAADFEELFRSARGSWETDLGAEFQKIKDSWDTMLKESQGQWQKELEGEIAAIKRTWLRQLEEHQREWQSRLNVFIESQPEIWQERLDEAAQKAGAAWNSQLDELEAKNKSLWEAIEKGLADAESRLSRLNEEIGDSFQRLKLRDDAMTTLAWPPFFQEGGALAGWKKRIEDRLAQEDPCAFDLFLALGRFNNAAREAGDRRKLAEVLHGVSVEAYRFWKSLGLAELDAALEWRSAFQGYLDASGVPMDIILALERDRFDTNTMLSVDAGSASRMYVKEALSWIVRDKSSDPPKVLCHARVITC